MNYEHKFQVVTDEFEKQILEQDLSTIIHILEDNNISNVEVLFGFAWGNFYHAWNELKLKPEQIQSEVKIAEAAGHGELGCDDLYIRNKHFEIQYCHHGDIHLRYTEEYGIVKNVIDAWLNKGWVLRKFQGKKQIESIRKTT